jgi:hypothetical protein
MRRIGGEKGGEGGILRWPRRALLMVSSGIFLPAPGLLMYLGAGGCKLCTGDTTNRCSLWTRFPLRACFPVVLPKMGIVSTAHPTNACDRSPVGNSDRNLTRRKVCVTYTISSLITSKCLETRRHLGLEMTSSRRAV